MSSRSWDLDRLKISRDRLDRRQTSESNSTSSVRQCDSRFTTKRLLLQTTLHRWKIRYEVCKSVGLRAEERPTDCENRTLFVCLFTICLESWSTASASHQS